jgi:hypothetical protein
VDDALKAVPLLQNSGLRTVLTYRTSTVTHPYIAFNIEGGRSSEPERLHVGKYLRLEHSCLTPRTAESADQLVVYWATGIERSEIQGLTFEELTSM